MVGPGEGGLPKEAGAPEQAAEAGGADARPREGVEVHAAAAEVVDGARLAHVAVGGEVELVQVELPGEAAAVGGAHGEAELEGLELVRVRPHHLVPLLGGEVVVAAAVAGGGGGGDDAARILDVNGGVDGARRDGAEDGRLGGEVVRPHGPDSGGHDGTMARLISLITLLSIARRRGKLSPPYIGDRGRSPIPTWLINSECMYVYLIRILILFFQPRLVGPEVYMVISFVYYFFFHNLVNFVHCVHERLLLLNYQIYLARLTRKFCCAIDA